jgi:predicted acylesterase/phospholipase RssA
MAKEASKPAISRDPILVDLALQGGGSHGAFTWGVLDRLLEEPWLRIDGISGTSAGAMNTAALVDGHANRGCPNRSGEFLEARIRGGSLQSFAARTARYDSRPLDPGPFANLCRDGPHVSPGVTL